MLKSLAHPSGTTDKPTRQKTSGDPPGIAT